MCVPAVPTLVSSSVQTVLVAWPNNNRASCNCHCVTIAIEYSMIVIAMLLLSYSHRYCWRCKLYPALLAKLKGTVSPYKRIFSNGSRMGSPLSNQVRGRCGFVTSRSRHLLARAWPAELALRPRSACTLALASEIDFTSVLKDAEGPAYLSFRCVAFVSWVYPPS